MTDAPDPVHDAWPGRRFANAGLILAQLIGALAGAGTLYLVGIATYYILPQTGKLGPGSTGMKVLFFTTFFGCAILGLGMTGGCLYGITRRFFAHGLRRPRPLTAGRRFADRLRGALLLGLSLLLGVTVLWLGSFAYDLWRAGRFGPAASSWGGPNFYLATGALAFGATASTLGAISSARRLLAPPDRPAS